MSNYNSGNFVRIDTFGADVEIAVGVVHLKSILATGYTSAKTIVFRDIDGNEIWRGECPTQGSVSWCPSGGFSFDNGIIFDDSKSDFAAGDSIFLYLTRYDG